MPLSLVFAVTLFTTALAISFNTYDIPLNEPVARQLPWSVTLSGTTGSRSAVPRRMQSFSCQNRLFISYTAHVGQYPDPQYPDIMDEETVGHLAEFTIGSNGAPTLVQDIKFSWCNDMGNLYATEDCSVISVLCRSNRTAAQVPGSVDFVELTKNLTGSYPFGWYVTSATDPTASGYRIVDQMFLLEFSSGVVSVNPPVIVMVSHSIGGWNFGHWEVVLNANKSSYFISLKTTIGSAASGWHEGATSFSFQRGGNWTLIREEWACGTGHIQANRVIYSKATDKFSRYCWTDLNYEGTAPNAIFYHTWYSKKTPAELRSIVARDGSYWNGNGGSMNLVPTSTGYLGSALGPGGNGNSISVGIINLPADSDNFNQAIHYYKWIDIPGDVDNLPVNNSNEIGFPNLQNFGTGGSSSGRFLLGWASGVQFQGVPTLFNLAEIDSDGCVYEQVALPTGGWGQDDVWAYLPSTGCVAMPYVWVKNYSRKYADCNDCNSSYFSSTLKLTVVCPSTTRSTNVNCTKLPYRDPLPTCSDKLQNQNETGVDCGGECKACPDKNIGKECWNSGGCTGGGVCDYCGGALCCRAGFGPDICGGLGCTSQHCCTSIPLKGTGGNCTWNSDCASVVCTDGKCQESSSQNVIIGKVFVLLLVLLVTLL